MKIISFFDSDYNFSATLARICDIESDELLFISDIKSLGKDSFNQEGIVIIDIDDYRESIDEIALSVKSKITYPIYGLINKMDIAIQKKSLTIGFDAIMTKSTFINNIKTIKKQIKNSYKKT